MATLPMAAIGAIWLMSVLGFNMSVAAAVGYIAVAGLAAETGVVMQAFLSDTIENATAGKAGFRPSVPCRQRWKRAPRGAFVRC